MKKTEKTALTAAIFAAAMCGTANIASEPVEASSAFTSTTTTVVGSEVAGNISAISPDAIKELNLKMAAVYGPPPSYDDSDNSEEDVITTTRTTTVPLYGPPRTTTVTPVPDEQETTTDFVIAEQQNNQQDVYGPPPSYGDIDQDGRVDVFDLIRLRSRFARNDSDYSFEADVNYDGKISVADLVVLNQFLLGKTDWNEEDGFEDEDVVTSTSILYQAMYGPAPSWRTTTTEDDEDTTTTVSDDVIAEIASTQTVYGPPWAMGTNTTTTTPVDFDEE